MWINVIRYEPHTLSLRPFKFFFQQRQWFSQLRSCFIKWYEKERSIELRPLRIHIGGCFETLNLLHVSSWWCFTWNETKNPIKPSRVHSTDWKSSLKVILYVELLKSHDTDLTRVLRRGWWGFMEILNYGGKLWMFPFELLSYFCVCSCLFRSCEPEE